MAFSRAGSTRASGPTTSRGSSTSARARSSRAPSADWPGSPTRASRKDYGEIPALGGLDLEVADGELLALLGPSGSGKSTALRVAAGLEEVDRGHRPHRRARRHPARRRRSATSRWCSSSYALFPHLTCRREHRLRARGRAGRPRREIARTRSRRQPRLTGCEACSSASRTSSRAASGSASRSRARSRGSRTSTSSTSRCPTSTPSFACETRAELKRLHRRVGTTMVYVTHDQVEALTLGTRVAVIDAGVLQQVGTPDEIYRRPVNRFVARFVGSPSMNLLPASLERRPSFAPDRSPSLPDGVAARPDAVEVGRPPRARRRSSQTATAHRDRRGGRDRRERDARPRHRGRGDDRRPRSPGPRLETGAPVRLARRARNVYVFDAEHRRDAGRDPPLMRDRDTRQLLLMLARTSSGSPC